MKKTTLKIIGSALLAPLLMLNILFITALAEIVFRDTTAAWCAEIFICICTILLVLLLERKMKPGELSLACNGAYFISAVVMAVPVFVIAVFYADNLQGRLNPWDHSLFFRGFQWLVYVFTVYAQVILHLIIRIIIAIVARIKEERKIADKEKYSDEE